ncbi:winged helix-turn-helix domain-containing protein [Streptomyces sp. NPDC057403]|uniref:winged helix-turn-helix domain-containing protein n=1 Tax=Streptomyces sp. NPDC057403 TaxID=3346119 RepID=UPI0036D14E6A
MFWVDDLCVSAGGRTAVLAVGAGGTLTSGGGRRGGWTDSRGCRGGAPGLAQGGEQLGGEAAGRRARSTGGRPHGRRVGEHKVLDAIKQRAIRQSVLGRLYDLGLARQLWTRAEVGDLIAKSYRVRLTEQGVGRYLRRWGLSFQRPDKRTVEQDAEAVRVWRADTWAAIHAKAKAKAEGGEVLFTNQVTGRTWGAKGCTPVVHRTGNRFSVNAMSAISTTGQMHFMVFTEDFRR